MRDFTQPPVPLQQPAVRVSFFILSPAFMCIETHWWGRTFTTLQDVMPDALALAELRAQLLPLDCEIREVRASIEVTQQDSLVFSQDPNFQGNPNYPTVGLALNCIPIRYQGVSGGTSWSDHSCVPSGVIQADDLSFTPQNNWPFGLKRYQENLCGLWQFDPGTWGWWGIGADNQGAPRQRIQAINGTTGDNFATVQTFAPHNFLPGDVVRVGLVDSSGLSFSLNEVWAVGDVTDLTFTIEGLPDLTEDIALFIGGYAKKMTLAFKPYSQFQIGKPTTRTRRPRGQKYTWEIQEEAYQGVLNPGCYAMCYLSIKHAYTTQVRLFRDNDVQATLRWFPVPDENQFLPVPHRFAGRPWRYDRTPPTIGPGELVDDPIVYEEDGPESDCWSWLGSDDWWENGVPFGAISDPNDNPIQTRTGICAPFVRGKLALKITLSGTSFNGLVVPCCPGHVIPLRLGLGLTLRSWAPFAGGHPPFINQYLYLDYYPTTPFGLPSIGGGWFGQFTVTSPAGYEIITFSLQCPAGEWIWQRYRFEHINPGFDTSFDWRFNTVASTWQCSPVFLLSVGYLDDFTLSTFSGEGTWSGVVSGGPIEFGTLALNVALAAGASQRGLLALKVALHSKVSIVEEGSMALVLDLNGGGPVESGSLDLALALAGESALEQGGNLALALALAGHSAVAEGGNLALKASLNGTSTFVEGGNLALKASLNGTYAVKESGNLALKASLNGTYAVKESGNLALKASVSGTSAIAQSGNLALSASVNGKSTPVDSGALALDLSLSYKGGGLQLVQKGSGWNNTQNVSSGGTFGGRTLSSNVFTGNTIIAVCSYGPSDTVQSVSDDLGNNYILGARINANNLALEVWYVRNAIGGGKPSVTFQLSSTGSGATNAASNSFEVSGLRTGRDVQNTHSNASGLTGTTGAVTTTTAQEFILAVICAGGGSSQSFTIPSGFTAGEAIGNVTGSNATNWCYEIVNAIQTGLNPSFTLHATSTSDGLIITFK